MHRGRKLLVLPVIVVLVAGVFALSAQPVRGLERDVNLLDILRFNPDTLTVAPGEEVSLRIVGGNTDHTFTLFAQRDADVPTAPQALEDYYDANSKISDVAVGPGEIMWANFTAPAAEGTYTYVCMIGGHAAAGMVGTLVVTTATGLDPVLIAVIIGVVAGVAVVVVFFVFRARKR